MSVGKTNINNIDVYLSRMQKSMLDKIFFIDKVFEPFEYIVDFGCANGELIRVLKDVCPEYQYIGYDLNPAMVEQARANAPGATFISNLDDLHVPFDRSLVNISSTIHEVYSYGTQNDIDSFWEFVFQSGFRYICIRDMATTEDMLKCPVDPVALWAVKSKIATDPGLCRLLGSFENTWGEIRVQAQLLHFLMKYKYVENWDREVKENYFPVTKEALLRMVPDNCNIRYCENRVLPYIAWQVQKDLGIRIQSPTHLKIILERSD